MIAAIWARSVTWVRSLPTAVSERTQNGSSTVTGPNATVLLTDAPSPSSAAGYFDDFRLGGFHVRFAAPKAAFTSPSTRNASISPSRCT